MHSAESKSWEVDASREVFEEVKSGDMFYSK